MMPSCNIRNVDESLMRKMKVCAAEEGLTLRDWVLRALTQSAFGTTPPKSEPKARKPEPKPENLKQCRHGLLYCKECQP